MDKKIGQEDVMELFRKMMNPMGLPAQNPFMPVLDQQELEKKISELRTVEMWLNSNLSMLQMSIKTLEYQRAMMAPAPDNMPAGAAADNPFMNPDLWPWNVQGKAAATAKKSAAKKSSKKAPK